MGLFRLPDWENVLLQSLQEKGFPPVCMGECFITILAGKWFLPCMYPNVTLQAARLGKCFITILAGKRFSPCMYPNVILQAARVGECFITIWILM